MATLLDGLTVILIDGKEATQFVHWNGSNPDFANNLQIWGEAGIVTIKSKMNNPKVKDRGVHCMMVGYALNHAGDTYRMWDRNTKLSPWDQRCDLVETYVFLRRKSKILIL